MSKGILGIGDSFMWGEGLYFYSDLPNLPFSENHNFDYQKITEGMFSYKNKHRFIQLVADYYDTWCTVKSVNGSSNEYNLEFLNTFKYTDVIEPDSTHHFLNKLDIGDIKLVIFLFTSHLRSRSDSLLIEDVLKEADKVFTKFESKGIHVCTLCWMPEFFNNPIYLQYYLNKNRHVPLIYKEKKYDWYEDVVKDDSFNLSIKSDFSKKGLQKNDLHFNKKGHLMVSNSIIKKLEQDKFNI